MRQRNNLLVVVLIAIIVILLVVLSYVLLIKPSISGYTVKAQNVGYAAAIINIMQQAATCQQVPLTFGNQTINLVAVECVNQALQQAQQQTQPAS